MTELKPCPFCGSNKISIDEVFSEDRGCNDFYVASCVDCHAEVWEDTSEEAIHRWNTRPSLWTTITDEASLPKESGTYLLDLAFETGILIAFYNNVSKEWSYATRNIIRGKASTFAPKRYMPIPEDK